MVKKIGVLSIGAAAILMLTGVAAWACTNLATLNLSQSAVTPGESVTVTGTSFSTVEKGGQPVQFHWSGPEGDLLAEVSPDATGLVVASVTIPADAQPGFYAMVATQSIQEQDGHIVAGGLSPAFGTPARVSVQVGDPVATPVAATPSTPAASSDGASSLLVALTGLLAVVGLGLFAAGFSVFMGEARRRRVPAPARTND
ncbi:MAG: hypothetical protein ACR2G7_03370 [Acidimicrobiales bacterium]